MPIELMIAEIRLRASPNWDAARQAVREATDEALLVVQDHAAFQMDDGWEETWADALRGCLLDDIDMIEQAWIAGGDSDAEVIRDGSISIIRSGGLSAGDPPTAMYSALQRFGESPAVAATGSEG